MLADADIPSSVQRKWLVHHRHGSARCGQRAVRRNMFTFSLCCPQQPPYQIKQLRNTAMTLWPLCVCALYLLPEALDTKLVTLDMGVHTSTHTYLHIYLEEHTHHTQTHTASRVRYANTAWISGALSCFVHQQLGVRYHITDWLQRHAQGQWIRTWSILGKEIQELTLKWTELN